MHLSFSPSRSNDYDRHAIIAKGYVDLIQTLVIRRPDFKQHVIDLVDQDDVAHALINILKLRPMPDVKNGLKLKPSPMTVYDELRLPYMAIEVMYAGHMELNGIYRFQSIYREAGHFVYEFLGDDGRPAYYSIYKYPTSQAGVSWYLSKTISNQSSTLGNQDIDYYFATSDRFANADVFPPGDGWRQLEQRGNPRELPIMRIFDTRIDSHTPIMTVSSSISTWDFQQLDNFPNNIDADDSMDIVNDDDSHDSTTVQNNHNTYGSDDDYDIVN